MIGGNAYAAIGLRQKPEFTQTIKGQEYNVLSSVTWDGYNKELDDVVGFYQMSEDTINVFGNNRVNAFEFEIYSDSARITQNWTFRISEENQHGTTYAAIYGIDGQMLADWQVFQNGEVIFFTGQTALILSPLGVNRIVLATNTTINPFSEGVNRVTFDPSEIEFLDGEPPEHIWPPEQEFLVVINHRIPDDWISVRGQEGPGRVNVIPGDTSLVMNYRFEADEPTEWQILEFQICQIGHPEFNRDVSVVILEYADYTGQNRVIRLEDVDGIYDFQLYPNWLDLAVDPLVCFSVVWSEIGQEDGMAKSGDTPQFALSSNEGFLARNPQYVTELYNALDLESRQYCLRQSYFVIEQDFETDTVLRNGAISLGRWTETAIGGMVEMYRRPFVVGLIDNEIDYENPLSLSDFRLFAGGSWGDMEEVDFYAYSGNINLEDDTLHNFNYPVHECYMVEQELIMEDEIQCLELWAVAGNVQPGDVVQFTLRSEDMVNRQFMTHYLDHDSEQGYDGPVLDDDPAGQGVESNAGWIWSDMSGNQSNGDHSSQSEDWINGHGLYWLDHDLRILQTIGMGNTQRFVPDHNNDRGELQVYPNPFNQSTTVSVNLPQSGNLTVSVYDLLGRRITELAHGQFTVGQHSFPFKGNNLASGQYLLQLSYNGFHKTQKIQLIK